MSLFSEKAKPKLTNVNKILKRIESKISDSDKSKYKTITKSVISSLKTLES